MNDQPKVSSGRLARLIPLAIIIGFISLMSFVARYVFVSADSFEYPDNALPNGLMSSPFVSPSVEISPSPSVSPEASPSPTPSSSTSAEDNPDV